MPPTPGRPPPPGPGAVRAPGAAGAGAARHAGPPRRRGGRVPGAWHCCLAGSRDATSLNRGPSPRLSSRAASHSLFGACFGASASPSFICFIFYLFIYLSSGP